MVDEWYIISVKAKISYQLIFHQNEKMLRFLPDYKHNKAKPEMMSTVRRKIHLAKLFAIILLNQQCNCFCGLIYFSEYNSALKILIVVSITAFNKL